MDSPQESVLDAIFEDGETLDGDGAFAEDVDMLDAEALDDGCAHRSQEPCSGSAAQVAVTETVDEGDVGAAGRGQAKRGGRGGGDAKKRDKKKNKKGTRGPSDSSITGINKFVIDTCRHLREKKSYLVWNAVGSLGVSVVRDLVKEVDAIQSCGGQKTADGRRFRTGGGILWNILKAREPEAYKEIMAKGREFEKQFRKHKTRQVRKENDPSVSSRTACETAGPAEKALNEVSSAEEVAPPPVQSSPKGERESVLNRIRVPVAYDDLFEEGEIV